MPKRVNSAAEDPCAFFFLPCHPQTLACPGCFPWSQEECRDPGVTDVLLTKVPGLPQSTEIDQRPDKNFRQGFALLGPCCSSRAQNK